MGGANQYRNFSSKRVNICGRVPSFYRNLCRYVCSGTMVIELREFNNNKKKKKKKKKKKNTMDKNKNYNFVIIWPKSVNLMKYLVHRFLLTCSVL